MTETADIRGPARATRNAGPVPPAEQDAAPAAAGAVKPEPAPKPATPAPPRPPARSGSGGFLPLALGGIVAGLIGYAVAVYAPLPEETDPAIESRFSDIEARLEGLAVDIEALSADVAASSDDQAAAVGGLAEEVSALRGDLADLASGLSALETAFAEAPDPQEVVPAPDFQDAFDDQMARFEAEIARVTEAAEAEVERARAEAEETRAAAETVQRQAELRAALASVSTALDTGAPFADELAGLDGLDVPESLTSTAETGIRPLAGLQRGFPEAARAAIAVSARGPEETAGALDRLRSFVMTQTNARSLEPREGDSVDAILSRAEAALSDGDLEAALAELQALPEEASEAIDGWLAAAQERQSAVEAVERLLEDIDEM